MSDYQPVAGDIYIQEVRAGRFIVQRHNGQEWEQIAALNEQEVQTLITPMQSMGESKGMRRYYRPAAQEEEQP